MIWYNSQHITIHDQTRSQQLKSCSDNVFCLWALKTICTAEMRQISMQEFGCHLVHQACVAVISLTAVFLLSCNIPPKQMAGRIQSTFLSWFEPIPATVLFSGTVLCKNKTFQMSSNHSLHSIVSCVVSSCLVESSYLCCHIHHFYLWSGFNETKTEPSPVTSDTSDAIRKYRGSFLCEN